MIEGETEMSTINNIRLPDPLSSPGAPGFTSVQMVDNNPMYRERLPGGKVLTLSSSAQYWGVTLSYEDLFSEEYNLLMSEILKSKQHGALIEVLLPHKENFNAIGNFDNVTIAPMQKGSELVLQNYNILGDTPEIKGVPKVGDIFKLTNHCSKVYTITESSLQGTTLKLGVYPNLMRETTGAEKPIFSAVLYQLSLEDPSTFNATFLPEGVYGSFSLALAESITYDN